MKKEALVVVLGELARSPRMQYHCLSLAANNFQVTVIGYSSDSSANPCPTLEDNDNIKQNLMRDPPEFKRYMPSFMAYLAKTIWQSISLFTCLIMTSIPDVILVQNPPSLPTLPILCFYRFFTRSKLIIDWHNYGYSILALNLKSDNHILVRVSKWAEGFFGRRAYTGFCVTEAMKYDLKHNWEIKYPLHVLYDRPPKMFRPLSLLEKHEFFVKIKSTYPILEEEICPKLPHEDCKDNSRFTTLDLIDNVIRYQRKRPALIMSSTSWTEDEDFSLLLDAFKFYDAALNRPKNENIIVPIPVPDDDIFDESDGDDGSSFTITDDISVNVDELPHIICVITGKGPLKELYEKKIAECRFSSKITFLLPWLSPADYAKMVASSDFGLSLHNSSSGVDLPMKVVDMFGCAVPVLAYDYNCINELVLKGVNGLTFKTSKDLYEKIVYILHDFYYHNGEADSGLSISKQTKGTKLYQYRNYLMDNFVTNKWEDNWNSNARDLILKD